MCTCQLLSTANVKSIYKMGSASYADVVSTDQIPVRIMDTAQPGSVSPNFTSSVEYKETPMNCMQNGKKTSGCWKNGKYALEPGILTEIVTLLSESGPWQAKTGPLLQTEFGKLQRNINLLFERHYSSDGSCVQYPTEALYKWQIKYRMQPEFEFGARAPVYLASGTPGETPRKKKSHSDGPAERIFWKQDEYEYQIEAELPSCI